MQKVVFIFLAILLMGSGRSAVAGDWRDSPLTSTTSDTWRKSPNSLATSDAWRSGPYNSKNAEKQLRWDRRRWTDGNLNRRNRSTRWNNQRWREPSPSNLRSSPNPWDKKGWRDSPLNWRNSDLRWKKNQERYEPGPAETQTREWKIEPEPKPSSGEPPEDKRRSVATHTGPHMVTIDPDRPQKRGSGPATAATSPSITVYGGSGYDRTRINQSLPERTPSQPSIVIYGLDRMSQ